MFGTMLDEYGAKRDFSRSPEPQPQHGRDEGPLIFVVQKHAARRTHYDLRLELDGVLKSWAITVGPSLDPGTKRLAVMVEDHPLDYASFEGTIPPGEYGAGQVIVWDTGTYSPEADGRVYLHDRAAAQEVARSGLAAGKLSFVLRGSKLKGSWTLVRMKRGEKDWLLIKHRDEFASAERDITQDDRSVLSGLTIEQLRAGHNPGPAPVRPGQIVGARRAPFPSSVAPMLASLTGGPFSDANWFFEPKLDGYRLIALVRDGEVRLLSRRGNDVTDRYRHLVEPLGRQRAAELVLDGEIIAVDERGRVCFQCLQQYLDLMKKAVITRDEVRLPVYYVFDILFLDGYDLRNVPQLRRKAILERLLSPSDTVRLVDRFEGDGRIIYETAVGQGLEGVIAKRKDAVYEPGRRSRNWLKVKSALSDEFVIGGYTQGLGSRTSTFGALLLGYHDDSGRLVYAGHVGTGFDEKALENLRQRLDGLKSQGSPFAGMPPLNAPATWVRAEVVAEVKFSQWTQDGYLRAPVFLRLREDKSPELVRRTAVVPGPPDVETPAETPAAVPQKAVDDVMEQLANPRQRFTIEVEGRRLSLSNMDKGLWPALANRRALIKRDLLVYLAKVSPYLLPHLRDRPLTLRRFPDGIRGEHFYQKHWEHPLPGFVATVPLSERDSQREGQYVLCNNLPTLLWLGQMANIEFHTWFSRVAVGQGPDDTPPAAKSAELADYPDFIVFDIDPYIYSGGEAAGEEPELNRAAFARTAGVARHLKAFLDSVSLRSFVKTSGKTGLHVFVPVLRQLDYDAVRSASETISRFVLRQHPEEATIEWSVERRTGKVFLDYNQNVRGKTLASAYSPRPTPEATVSVPLRWEELDEVYPTDFTILSVPDRLTRLGDPWAGILEAKTDLRGMLDLR